MENRAPGNLNDFRKFISDNSVQAFEIGAVTASNRIYELEKQLADKESELKKIRENLDDAVNTLKAIASYDAIEVDSENEDYKAGIKDGHQFSRDYAKNCLSVIIDFETFVAWWNQIQPPKNQK